MKKTLFAMAFCALLVFYLSACSGKKVKEQVEKAVIESVEKAGASTVGFDMEGIKALVNKDVLTESDCDFILDQLEIYVKKMEKNTDEKLSADDAGAVMVLGLAIASAEKDGILTERQLARCKELETISEKK